MTRVADSMTRRSDSVASSPTDSTIPSTRMMTRNHQADRLRLPSADPKMTRSAAQAMFGGAGTNTTSMTARTPLSERARAGKIAVIALNAA